jgi:hypothetical protein
MSQYTKYPVSGGGGGGTVISVSAVLPLVSTGGASPVLSMPQATGLVDGYLSSIDWATFNSKQDALTPGSISTTTTGVTVGSGAASTVGPAVTINIATASAVLTGLLSSTDFTTFNAKVSTSRTISTTAPLTGGGDLSANRTLSMPVSTNAVDGYLSAADHTTFAAKQAALTIGNLTEVTSAVLTITGGTGSVIGAGAAIQVKQASGVQGGYLSAADYSSFSTGLYNGNIDGGQANTVFGGGTVINGGGA